MHQEAVMQVKELKEQLAQPSYELFVSDGADVNLARDAGLSTGGHVFAVEDAARLIQGIINMEAYFHHLRETAMESLKSQLARRYKALAVVMQDEHEIYVQLKDGTSLPLPGHTSPALNELMVLLEPAEGCDNPRIALELIQQIARLMQVLGLDRLELRDTNTARHNDAQPADC